ncbi:hypothetical protein [Spirilliplanes yamanashiensis]|uniref:Phosphatidate cytidylyltransferase n=1 Tax=Spirilliplanes yamanashiensis TaxID=42233 RepID=A0A8J3Y5Y1_9ACTN|nr:hypothetical protein [Spirilliplanes yamanashiensis]MDP9814453.1 hypothetical protein [Spirilliplanes yamanashiensis]GIJ02104.1 hypothetical protein Sya03_14560 [Spirilliplanes yamanashiensis]
MLPTTGDDGDRDPWGPGEPPRPGRATVRGAVQGDPWDDDVSGVIRPGRTAERRSGVDRSGTERRADELTAALVEEAADEPEEEIEVPFVPVRPRLSVAIAGFAGLLGLGLILGAQTAGPGSRLPYAVVVFGVQLLFVLAWTMAQRPPALRTVAVVAVGVAVAADAVAMLPAEAGWHRLLYVFAGGVALITVAQLAHRISWQRAKDALGGTALTVGGVVALASLIVLTRRPGGTQTVLVCLTATAVALVAARLLDAVFARPRIARQVPRGATGIVAGAMLGTLVASILGSLLTVPFTPGVGAVIGFVAAGLAGLVDLGVNYAEAGRNMVGRAPNLWVARHMQGPLGAFALAAPVAYVLAVVFVA